MLLRDQLRRDEGAAPPGYSLGELLLLCRSAVAAQRVAGLGLVAELMALARPRPEDLRLHAPAAAGAAAGAGGGGGGGGAGGGGGGGGAGGGGGGAWVAGAMVRRFVPIPEHLRDR